MHGHVDFFRCVIKEAMEFLLIKKGPFCCTELVHCEEILFLGIISVIRNTGKKGNHEVAIHHWKIAAEAGNQLALDKLTYIFNAESKIPGEEFISKEYLNKAYRICHEAQKRVKSEEREKHTQAQNEIIEMKC